MRTLVCGALGLAFLASSSASAQSAEENVSICDLAKAGAQMNGRHVRVSVIYVTDLLETSVLKDRRCPSVHVAPNWNESTDPSLAEFNEALYAQPDELRLTTFSLDVSGTFLWRSADKPQASLVFEKVWTFRRVCSDWLKSN